MKKNYKGTLAACFVGYGVQALINALIPLLFLTLSSQYRISLTEITWMITVNFTVQLLVDLLSALFMDRIGYRACAVLAHLCAAAGLILLTILPEIFPNPLLGLLLSVVIYAIGGGILEVLISPVVEACPTKNKEAMMSLLHSFFCWGVIAVVLGSTLFFVTVGIEHWKWLVRLWALVPLVNAAAFTRVPIYPLVEEGEKGQSIWELFRNKYFWILFLLMFCAGASENSVSQWASSFAEKALGVNKTIGDLTGLLSFAVFMGLSRVFYSKYGEKMQQKEGNSSEGLMRFILCSSVLCVISYLVITLTHHPAAGLLGCGLCGLSVGILWPGTFSIGAAMIKNGGTAMFALFALAGDLGCGLGPTFVGTVSGYFQDNLKCGILAAVIFPGLLTAGCLLLGRMKQKL